MPIKILSEETINKIAAGEVIDRPANVIKELIENSIDAKAKTIGIEISNAGKKLLRVRDDGIGMDRADLMLSVTRHATSKITVYPDLFTISTFGFRGEALASIAAVSNFTLKSRPVGWDSGWEIKISGGKIRESRAAACAQGTIAEVHDLFFNTPAREKFLKSENTEKHHIIKIVEEIAIANKEVSFTLIIDEKTIFQTTATNSTFERILDIYGKEFASKLTSVNATHPFVSLTGFCAKQGMFMPTKDYQLLFVNKRPVKFTKSLMHAFYQAYRPNLPEKAHPAALLLMDINPEFIDINVHPTKREIKFSKEQELHSFLLAAIKNAIFGSGTISQTISAEQPTDKMHYSQNFAKFNVKDAILANQPYIYKENEISHNYIAAQNSNQNTTLKDATNLNIDGAEIKIIGQLFKMFILAQKNDALLLIDQHAAHERIMFEKYFQQITQGSISIQNLLIPITLELPQSQYTLLEENFDNLSELGIKVEPFGLKTAKISAIPSALGFDPNAKAVLLSALQALGENLKISKSEKIEKIAKSACTASIKASEFMTTIEMETLVKNLFECLHPFNCPHGRPTLKQITRLEMEKFFGRK